MVSIRVFSIALVFILVLIGDSSAHSQVMETTLVADGSGLESEGKSLPKSGKDVNDANPAAAETGNSRLEARKMMLKWGLDKKTVTVVEEGSDQSVGKSSHKSMKGISNVNRKLRNKIPHHHRHGKAKMAGFTAFSADYHVPKSHPPKNN